MTSPPPPPIVELLRRRHRIPRWKRNTKQDLPQGDVFGRVGRTRASKAHHQRKSSLNNVIANAELTGARRRGAPQSILLTNEEGDERSVLIDDRGGSIILQRKTEIPEPVR